LTLSDHYELVLRTNDPAALIERQRGWCVGHKEFRKELLEQMSEQMGTEHFGSERRESQEDKADRIVREELQRLRWKQKATTRQRQGGHRDASAAGKGSRTYAQNLVKLEASAPSYESSIGDPECQ